MTEDINSELKQIEDSKKDSRHFEPLYKKYYEQIVKFVYKRMENLDDCREVTSRVFTKAILNIGKYKHMGFPFSSWLYRIAINEINQFYRDSKKTRAISIDDTGAKYIAEETGQQKADLLTILSNALQHLEEDEIQLIELRFFDGKAFSEIGEILEITENNAKVRTYRIIDKLRELFIKLDQ
ncbi:MAG: sigma-70 family RNA polymerase sigma factor [Bacteroidia bacterium]